LDNPITLVKNQRVMISPLNWGLGHVTRTIPIIRELLKQNNEVIVCCDETQERFYRNYFPGIWYVPMEGYPFVFKGKGKWVTDIGLQLRKLNAFRNWELQHTAQLVRDFSPDLLISDQRFGFRNNAVESVIISHQLKMEVPFYASFVNWMNQSQLSKFNNVWVPDLNGSLLSGDLSGLQFQNKHYIGWQSRFNYSGFLDKTNFEYDYLVIVSGPEPYASMFYQLVVPKVVTSGKSAAVIAPSKLITKSARNLGNCKIFVQPDVNTFEYLLENSKTLISRSGYSTLMDLSVTNNDAILIPTPGQTEQLYLAKRHANHQKWKFINESEFLQLKL
jgi:hypothetical protein